MIALYWRLSGFYFFYFAAIGVAAPYWSLYLKSLGLTPARIGELLAITLASKLFAPFLWGWLADRSGQRMTIVRLSCLATAVGFSGVFLAGDSLVLLALVMLLYSFFWNAALPQFEANTLNHLGVHSHRYGSIRLWGSVGFIIASIAVGMALQHAGVGVVPVALVVLFVLLWFNSLVVPARAGATAGVAASLKRVLRQPRVVALLLVCCLIQASHGPYYAFFTIYLQDLDYSGGMIGALWSLGVLAEIGIFLLMGRFMARFSHRGLLLLTAALTSVRWLLTAGFAEHLTVLLFTQLLHAFSFGMYHAVAIALIHRFFSGSLQGRGQALYSSVSFGIGGAAGSLAAGYLWEGVGPGLTFVVAAGVSFLGLLIAWRGLHL